MGTALSALLAALAEGAGGDAGRVLAEAADGSGRPEALRAWGDRVAELLGGDPRVAGAVAAAMERHAPGSAAAWYGGDHSDFRGGVFLREVVGVQVVIQQGGGAAAPEALASLPPKPSGFTGREDETAELLRALDDSAAALVSAVSGLGGIGKTALAVETAYLACGKGWFPGGVLFVDLHGYDEQPVSAGQALQSLLRALGVPPEQIPATADDRASLYRSVLAQRAAVLVLADNASSPGQVRPLLPGKGRHRVLVTSRDRLPQLGARLVPLGQLTPEEARRLLESALRIADPEDSRVADDPEAAGQLAGLCGHLPLALQIAAALLAEDPGMAVAELVAELGASHDRLVHLDDGERSVRAAFELSYRRLPPEQARLLRLLALVPGPEVSGEVAAALLGADAPPLRELKGLARAHMVERGSGRGWWRLHDLVRVFGAGVVAGDGRLREEGEAARERVLASYAWWAEAADQRLKWLPGMPEPERFENRAQAMAWLDGERVGLVAAAGWAREKRFAVMTASLAGSLGEYLLWRRYFDDLISVMEAARESAHQAGDQLREARASDNLGIALREAGRTEEAIDAHTHAWNLFQAVGDRRDEAMAWTNLGLALREAGRTEEAISAHTRARDLHHAAKDRQREAIAWINLGLALSNAGRPEEEVEAVLRALDLFQAVGDRHREGMGWTNLGLALREVGRPAEEIDAHSKALEIFLEFEDWYRVGQTLHNLALTHQVAHSLAEARTYYLQAADAYTRADAAAEATEVRTYAALLGSPFSAPTAPAPTDKPVPASPPARTTDSAPPAPPPPSAPDTGEP
ncbi:tetratricopeptide repeat protein [Streptomyces sp. NPDC054770]